MHFVAFCDHRIIEDNGIALLFGFVEFDGNHDLVEKIQSVFLLRLITVYRTVPQKSIR